MNIGETLTVIIFAFGGIKMAMDTALIEGVVDVGRSGERTRLMDISSGRPVPCKLVKDKFKVLMLKETEPPYGIVIDHLEEITTLGLDSIRPLPALLSSQGGVKMFWGAALRGDEVLLLVEPESGKTE